MSDKHLAFILIPLGVILTISSLFVFAIGWNKLTSYLESGSINGLVFLPLSGSPFIIKAEVQLFELDGNHIEKSHISSDGRFEFLEVPPGDYSIQIIGRGLRATKKVVTVFKKRSTEIDPISMQFDVLSLGEKEEVPSYRYASTHKDYAGNLWAVGFQSKESKSTYKVLKKTNGTWNEVIIPHFKGAIQSISINSLDGNVLLIGSAGNGAVISRDRGQSWNKLDFDDDIWGMSDSVELPDKSWVVAAVGGKRYQYSRGVILISKDKGASWDRRIETNDSINRLKVLSSGRILFSTESLAEGASIFYSDDYGESWDEASIPQNYKLRGISDLLEAQSGDLYASNIDGSNWKGDFTKGGLILKSQDNGLTWKIFHSNPEWRGINALYENDEGHLFVWSGADIHVTFDDAEDWSKFGQTGSGYKRTLIDGGKEIYIIGGQSLYSFDSDVFSPTGFSKHLHGIQ